MNVMQCILNKSDNDNDDNDDYDYDENKDDGIRLDERNKRRASSKAKRVDQNVRGQTKCNALGLVHPCIRRLHSQYERQSKLSCSTETTQ